MKPAAALQSALERWQLFAPCLGTNVGVEDSAHGPWSGASGYAEPDTKAPMPVAAHSYSYRITS
jgi:hypothetical protein